MAFVFLATVLMTLTLSTPSLSSVENLPLGAAILYYRANMNLRNPSNVSECHTELDQSQSHFICERLAFLDTMTSLHKQELVVMNYTTLYLNSLCRLYVSEDITITFVVKCTNYPSFFML